MAFVIVRRRERIEAHDDPKENPKNLSGGGVFMPEKQLPFMAKRHAGRGIVQRARAADVPEK